MDDGSPFHADNSDGENEHSNDAGQRHNSRNQYVYHRHKPSLHITLSNTSQRPSTTTALKQ